MNAVNVCTFGFTSILSLLSMPSNNTFLASSTRLARHKRWMYDVYARTPGFDLAVAYFFLPASSRNSSALSSRLHLANAVTKAPNVASFSGTLNPRIIFSVDSIPLTFFSSPNDSINTLKQDAESNFGLAFDKNRSASDRFFAETKARTPETTALLSKSAGNVFFSSVRCVSRRRQKSNAVSNVGSTLGPSARHFGSSNFLLLLLLLLLPLLLAAAAFRELYGACRCNLP
mmetsp:Transcript_4322/g.14155  ORF Transcript_4322/g.14155 Transcript_4322/m.14155 type:complete len:230 (-) Transcript_4322:1174-1863(-)